MSTRRRVEKSWCEQLHETALEGRAIARAGLHGLGMRLAERLDRMTSNLSWDSDRTRAATFLAAAALQVAADERERCVKLVCRRCADGEPVWEAAVNGRLLVHAPDQVAAESLVADESYWCRAETIRRAEA